MKIGGEKKHRKQNGEERAECCASLGRASLPPSYPPPKDGCGAAPRGRGLRRIPPPLPPGPPIHPPPPPIADHPPRHTASPHAHGFAAASPSGPAVGILCKENPPTLQRCGAGLGSSGCAAFTAFRALGAAGAQCPLTAAGCRRSRLAGDVSVRT